MYFEYFCHDPQLQVQIHLSVRLCWPRSFPNGTPVFSDLYSGASFNKFSAQFTKQYSGFMINLDLPCTAVAQWWLDWLLLSHRLLLRHVFTTRCLSLWNTANDTRIFDTPVEDCGVFFSFFSLILFSSRWLALNPESALFMLELFTILCIWTALAFCLFMITVYFLLCYICRVLADTSCG